jgi:hypothetical protein
LIYASKIKKTANGSRRCISSQAWTTAKKFFTRRIQENGEIDEPKGVKKNGQDKTQETAYATAKAALNQNA